LGNGLGTIYPLEHEKLADEIAGAGALVSEFAMEMVPDAKNFPRRNRIIAGLSLGVIVVEAGKASGALITARLANEYNREVFALPGRVDRPEWTAGVNGLIRDGQAKLITCLDDVLDELAEVGEIMRKEGSTSAQASLGESGARVPTGPKLDPNERLVLEAVRGGAEDVDTIISSTGLDMACVVPSLTSLQIKGLIRQLPGGLFVNRS
jgi:DNA processing protein